VPKLTSPATLRLTIGAAFALLLACGGGGGGGPKSSLPNGPAGAWQGAHLTEIGALNDAWYPSVAMDGTGRALTTWYQNSGGTSAIWANAYAPASGGWQGEGTLEPALTPASGPKVAINAAGAGMIVWEQSDGTQYRIYGMRYQTGVAGVYGTQDLISTTAADAGTPAVAVNAGGSAVVAWVQSDGANYHAWANLYTPGSGWGTPTQLETSATDSSITPSAAIDDAGNATVVWQRALDLNSLPYTVWVARWHGGAWSAAPTLLHAGSGDTGNPAITMGSAGAIATWTETLDGGGSYQIHTSRWTSGTDAWSAPVRVSPTTEHADMPAVAVDGSGNALLVWEQTFGGVTTATALNMASSQYSAASGWSTIRRLDTLPGTVGPAAVAMNASGSANVVWNQNDGVAISIFGVRYSPTGGWGAATTLETDQSGSAYAPAICVGANGDAMAVWYQKDGAGLRHIYTNRFH